jgi:hypothetical protein
MFEKQKLLTFSYRSPWTQILSNVEYFKQQQNAKNIQNILLGLPLKKEPFIHPRYHYKVNKR